MARGRMLNRKVSRSRKVADLSRDVGPWAVVFHHRLIANLDINGNCRADRWWLKSELHPLDDDVLPEDCDRFAAALVDHELAKRYEVDGMQYLHVPDFQNEQGQLRRDKEKPQVPDIKEGRAVDGKPPGGGPPVGRSQVEVEVEEEKENQSTDVDCQKKGSGTTSGTPASTDGETNVGPPVKRQARRHALPADWKPNEKHHSLALELGLDLNGQVEEFRDYEAGKRRVMLDWDATFRNWLRNTVKFQGRNGHKKGGNEKIMKHAARVSQYDLTQGRSVLRD